MALHLRRKTRAIEPQGRTIKLEGFRAALEARSLAQLRTAAKAQLQNGRHPGEGWADARDGAANGGANADEPMGGEERGAGGGNAAPMDVDGDAAAGGSGHAARRAERERAREQRLEAQRLERERRRGEQESARLREWEAAERRRKEQLAALEAERAAAAAEAAAAERDHARLTAEMAQLNAGKAELVAQLKQVLQLDEASRSRSLPMRNSSEGELAGALSK